MANEVVNKRLSNRVIWSLEDIAALAIAASGTWDTAHKRAKLKCADPALMLALAEIKSALADIRVLATVARSGEYAGKRFIEYDDEP